MKTSQKGIDLIKKFEGIKLKAYQCSAGVWTIGYGHTSGVKSTDVITKERAEALLNSDLPKYEAKVNKYASRYGWNQNEFDALVSFAFNIGSIDKLTANGTRSRQVIADKMLAYKGAGGKVIDGLITRRKAERELFLSKDYTTGNSSVTSSKSNTNEGLVKVVQDWLNTSYGTYIVQCESCDKKLLKVDGVFGAKTKSALVVALQVWLNTFEGVNLKVDGVLGDNTKKVCKSYTVSETKNSRTTGAQIVQAILYCYGYNPQLFSQAFNCDCTKALKEYQSNHKLSADGIAGVLFFTSSLG